MAALAFVVYNANGREIGSYDSQPAKLAAIELASRGTLRLNHVVGAKPQLADRPAIVQDRAGNWRGATPVFSALPAAAVGWLLSCAGLLDLKSPETPPLVAKLAASLVTAGAVGFAFVAARRRVGARAAFLIAAALGFGTNLWGCASQTLWQHESVLFGLMGSVAVLGVRGPIRPRQAACVGMMLGVALAARPFVAPAVGLLLLSAVYRAEGWSRILPIVPVVATAAALVGTNLMWFGHPLGGAVALEALHPALHGVSSSFSPAPWIGALGLLVSANRGLLIFSPIVAFALPGFVRGWREGPRGDLWWNGLAFAAQFAAYSCYSAWWGGHTYGPRYMLDTLPMLVPAAAAWFPTLVSRKGLATFAACALAWSVYVAWIGAFVHPAGLWNSSPRNVDHFHERLWDFGDSQIVHGAREGWNPRNFALLKALR